MQIKRVYLEGIANFAKLDLELRAGLNLICGPNGVGKTTVLDAIAQPFIGPFGGMLRRGALVQGGSWKVEIEVDGSTKSTSSQVTSFLPEEKDATDNAFLKYSKYLIYIKTGRNIEYQKLSSIPADRNTTDTTTGQNAKSGVGSSDLKGWLVQRWLFSHIDGNLEDYAKANLKAAIGAFSALDSTVAFSHGDRRRLDIIVKTVSGEIPFEYLSSGFKSSLFIILGIIKEIEVRNIGVSAENFSGVILIDEPDLHLHPTWQQAFIPALSATFPCAQIVASTHSPHMVQAAKPTEVIALSSGEGGTTTIRRFDDLPYGFAGWTVEEILTDVMGIVDTRTRVFREAVSEFELALACNDTQRTQTALSRLEDMLHPQSALKKVYRIQASEVLAGQ